MARDLSILVGIPNSVKEIQRTIDDVIKIIRIRQPRGKKVMLEIPGYPVPDRYMIKDNEFYLVFEGIAHYLNQIGAQIVFGDSKELIKNSQESKNDFNQWKQVEIKRAEHLLSEAEKESPRIIVASSTASDYLRRRLKCNYYPISSV